MRENMRVYIKNTIKFIGQVLVRVLIALFVVAYFISTIIPTAHADSDTESEIDSTEQQEQQPERLDASLPALSDFHQCMAEKKYVGSDLPDAKSLDKSLSPDLYMEWTGPEETDTVELSSFVTKQLAEASSKQQAENKLEETVHTNNKITKELLDRNFHDHRERYVSEMDEPKLISMPSREPGTTFSNLNSIESEYSKEETKILQHHVKSEKLILDTSKPILDSFDKDQKTKD